MEHLQEYEELVKERIAAACLDRKDDGTCDPPDGRNCALDFNLPDIVRAVKAVKSDKVVDYGESIEQLVCEQCINREEHSDPPGECYYRDRKECCLDNFMIIVVDAIEEVDARYSA